MYSSMFSHLPLRAVLFADGVFSVPEGKTAQGVLRHSTILDTVAIVDRTLASSTSNGVLPGTHVPIVASLQEAMALRPEAFVVAMTESDVGEWKDGVFTHAPREPGNLPDFLHDQLRFAAANGMHLLSCLHARLRDTGCLDQLTGEQKAIDIRQPYEVPPKYSGRRSRKRAKVVHIAGSDCVVGKRTSALQLQRAALARNINAGYVGTGQTCLLVGCDEGAVIDRTPVFQAAGLVERLIEKAELRREVLFIKGQASVLHPAFGGLALAILQGSQPDAIVFAHDFTRKCRYHWEHLPVGDPRTEIKLIEELSGAPVVAISTRGQENIRQLSNLGLPVADPLVGSGLETLLHAVLDAVKPTRNSSLAHV